MQAEEKIRWIRRAFQLARLGSAAVAPNPLVGCVILHPEHGLIAEGWHRKFGEAHAEVNAVHSVRNPELLPGSTAILNLEPCAHYGKTPPCASLLIKKGISEVIISNTDPNPLVSGKGIQLLRDAGIRVECGILEKEGRELNRFFFHAQEKQRPYVTLKWAQSADGFIAAEGGKQVWISSAQSRLLVHKIRSDHQAIIAGRHTLRLDNPLLNMRNWPGRQPVRLVVDSGLRLDKKLKVFQDAGAATWVLNDSVESSEGHLRHIRLPDSDNLQVMLDFLFGAGIHSLLVEGGSRLITKFIESGLWDEALVFSGPEKLGQGIKGPVCPSEKLLQDRESCGPDLIEKFRNYP